MKRLIRGVSFYLSAPLTARDAISAFLTKYDPVVLSELEEIKRIVDLQKGKEDLRKAA